MLATDRSLGAVLAEESAKLETVTVNRARRYQTPGGIFPSVTNAISVLDKPALLHWSAQVERELCVDAFINLVEDGTDLSGFDVRGVILDRIGSKFACYRKRDEAGDTGTTTHALIEYHLKRQLGYAGLEEPEVPNTPQGEAALWAYIQFEEFARSVSFKPVAMEIAVWSRAGFAGRFDLLAYVEGKLSILDWKTSKAIYPESLYQNAAYRLATNERLEALGRPERVARGHIVLLPKTVESDTKFVVHQIDDDEPARDVFLAVLSAWHAMDRAKKAGIK